MPSGCIKRAPCVPKRELSPLQRARLSLGLEVNIRPQTSLARLLRRAGLVEMAMAYLQFSEDEQARKIVALHARLNATERKAVTIDYLVLAAKADPHHIWGCIQEELSRAHGMGAGIIACMDAIKVMIERAKRPEGHQDRKLLFQITGILPMPGQPGPLALVGRKG